MIDKWRRHCRFLPDGDPIAGTAMAARWVAHVISRLIEEDGYDHRFDMAVREWGRSDARAAEAVERTDGEHMTRFERFFAIVGYPPVEAAIRARVFYYHRIGYYPIGVAQTVEERKRLASIYLDIICGPAVMAAARAVV